MSLRAEREMMGRFHDAARPNLENRKNLETGLESTYYGGYLARMAHHGAMRIEAGDSDPILITEALCIASDLYRKSETHYRTQPRRLRGDALKRHKRRVLAGRLEILPDEVATTNEMGIAQVKAANAKLGWRPRVEGELAELNYGAFFKPNTMAGATRTLDRRPIEDLLIEQQTKIEAMPHLSVSNWAIGQTVAGIYRELGKSKNPGRLRIIDIGSGHGATLAAITTSLKDVADINGRPDLAVSALETTPEFYAELEMFAERDLAASEFGLERVKYTSETTQSISNFGALTTVNKEAVGAIRGSDVESWDRSPNDITVVTANYAFHRLPDSSKKVILKKLSSLPNVIFIVGDLKQNTSIINKGYFNLAANGALNCGNLTLDDDFRDYNYKLVDLEQERPESLDPRLASRINHDHHNNDGHLWIAHRGEAAASSLRLVKN